MTNKQKKEWRDQAMYGVVGLIAFCLWNVDKQMKGHISSCTKSSNRLIGIGVAIGVIVLAQLILNWLGFHFK